MSGAFLLHLYDGETIEKNTKALNEFVYKEMNYFIRTYGKSWSDLNFEKLS